MHKTPSIWKFVLIKDKHTKLFFEHNKCTQIHNKPKNALEPIYPPISADEPKIGWAAATGRAVDPPTDGQA